MTPIQTPIQAQIHTEGPADLADLAELADMAGLQVCDDMTVEVALSVMAGARTGHLLVCDNDGLRTGTVTRVQLAGVREGAAYTDRLRLRDVPGDGVPDDVRLTPGVLALAR
ncbi:hypothetical protein [Streptomyces exfoliatus]|uniref:hypothetical protein n=1 Tax=Streptomyces exfoliatus TaxID=1905 RepID=UPI0037BBAF6E